MLQYLHIKNLGLVEEASLDFERGFTVFSGETGAGKSMLLSSLLLLSGSKGDESIVRQGADATLIVTEWNISKNIQAQKWLEDHAFSLEDDTVNVRRIVKRKGRTQCFIQGTIVSLQELSQFFSLICEIHAQHEHQSLFKVAKQTGIIYEFAAIEQLFEQYRVLLTQLTSLVRKNLKQNTNKESLARELDYLQYATKEIDDAALLENEDEELMQKIYALSNIEEMKSLWNEFFQYMEAETVGAIPLLEKSKMVLETISAYQKDVQPQQQQLESILFESKDVIASLQFQLDRVNDSEQSNIFDIEARLSLIEGLKKKYGASIGAIRNFYETSQTRIHEIQTMEQDKELLPKQIIALFKELFNISSIICEKRDSAILKFQEKINDVLHSLAMPHAYFEIRTKQSSLFETYSKEKDTLDDAALFDIIMNNKPSLIEPIEFYIRTNKGMNSDTLSKIASGGELSRVMFAITVVGKQGVVLSGNEDTEKDTFQKTLILDEVDAGLGGKTAVSLAQYLKNIAQQYQIICVTHLPIIAASAQHHILVQKMERDTTTIVRLELIENVQRKREIARMLVGNDNDELALQQAEKLLLKE